MGTPLPKITIELLTEQDAEWAARVAAARMIAEEVGRPELVNFDNLDLITATVISTGTALIAKVDGVCAGVVGGFLGPNVFNYNYTTLTEVIWYVLPEYRNTRVGLLLLKAFMDLGEEKADETMFCLINTSPVKIQTMEKRGFQLCEFNFRKQNGVM
jgi:hypothetical protein